MTALSGDPHALQRFVDAQAPVYAQVCAELAAGAKRSHWMWFIFPQLRALGRSATALHFGIGSQEEALAYWQHVLLGARLRECTALMLAVPPPKTALAVLGAPDDLKFHSCMSLFAQVVPEESLFSQALQRYFDDLPDARTLALLEG